MTNTSSACHFFYAGERDRTLRDDVKWDNHDLWNITQNDFEIKLLRKVRAQPLLCSRIDDELKFAAIWGLSKKCTMPRLSRLLLAGKNYILYCRDYKKNKIIMKLIYRTLLLNKVCAQGSGAARRSAVRLTKRKSFQRYEVYQITLFFDVYLTCLIFFVSNRKPWKAVVFGKNRAILCIYVWYFSKIGCFDLLKATIDEY